MQSPRLQDLCNSVDWEHEMNKKEPLMKIYSVARDLGQYLILNLMEHSQYILSPRVYRHEKSPLSILGCYVQPT